MIGHPGFLSSLGAFLLIVLPVVFIHELGHYLVGRWCGIGAQTFSVGFGHELVGWTDARGTRWKLGWLPLGGYVRFKGDMSPAGGSDAAWLALPAAERNQTFQAKRLWQRAVTVAAGPAINFLLALLILAGFALAYGEVRTAPVVGSVLPGSAAAAAGLRVGDRLTAVAGHGVDDFSDVGRVVALRAGERVRIDFTRGGVARATDATVAAADERDRFGNVYHIGRLGVGSVAPSLVPVPVWRAPAVAARQFGSILSLTVGGLKQVVLGRVPMKELSGPVGVARVAGEQLAVGWGSFTFLVAMLSINLGFINLLPVPMLDGGHLFFYAVEAVRRRPVGPRVQEWAFRGGLVALLVFMLVLTANDLGRAGWWRGLAGLIG